MQSQEIASKLHKKLVLKAKAEDWLKELNKKIGGLTSQLNESMSDEELDSLEIQGIKYSPKTEEDFALDAEMVETNKWDESVAWFEWLESNGHGDMIKTKKSVHAGTRKSFLKELRDEGVKLPEWILVKHHDTIKYNKSAISRLAKEEPIEA